MEKYDVFISFRGTDSRNAFTSHLRYYLENKGIQTFMDDEQLVRGQEISPSLTAAIEGSKISIVVLSPKYASSAWCLDELVKIMECRDSFRQLVWPIFFHVEPSHVRNQTHSIGQPLAEYEADPTYKYKKKLPGWRIALNKAGNLSGWTVSPAIDESEIILRVAEAALSKLNRTHLYVAKYLVGIEDRLEDLGKLIIDPTKDVHVIGIYGVGGIGKSTVVKALFNKYADEFEGSSFLANVGETSKQRHGLIQLQETLLYDMLGDRHLKIWNTHRGINIMRKRLCYKRILLVLDDVDQLEQLETLAGGHDWFGPESRVIITTRNKHFLTTHGADVTYEMKGFNDCKALELFSWNAFKRDQPLEGFYKLSKLIVDYTESLPLALVVLGSHLCGRSKIEWESAINNMKRKPHERIYEILKISFDALQDDEKSIFLDIACFFVGEDKDYVIKILGSPNFCPIIGIRVLTDMSLITIESDKVQMHHLIQEVGLEVVRQESPEVEKRSRLWLTEDVLHIFSGNMGTNAIEGIKLDLPELKTLYLSSKAVKKMKRLRILIFRNVVLSKALGNLPNNLRYIHWPGYQFPTLPFNSGPKQLVILHMPRNHIKQLGKEFKNFENLKVVNLSSSKLLTKIPDLSTAPNLESLCLDHCTNLVEIDESVGSLSRLVTLDLQFCCNLKILPSSLQSKYLGTLNLKSCSSLQRFPNIDVEMNNLMELCLSGTAIKKSPDLSRAPNLKILYLDHCTNLVEIHDSVGYLCNLVTMDLQSCCNLKILPSSLGSKHLRTLNLICCFRIERFPNISVKMKYLTKLCLSCSAIIELPSSIDNLVALEVLNLAFCEKLEHISSNIYNLLQLQQLSLRGCSKLCKFPKLISSSNSYESLALLPDVDDRSLKFPFPYLESLDLQNCNLSEVDFLVTPNGFDQLQLLCLGENKFVNLPPLDRLSKLWYLHLNNCEFLREIPELPQYATHLYASNCKSLLEIPDNIMAKIIRNKLIEIQVILPGLDIPHWFSNKFEGDSIDVLARSNGSNKLVGVIICAVFEVDCEGVNFSLEHDEVEGSTPLLATRSGHVFPRLILERTIHSMKSGNMWLHYLPGSSISLHRLDTKSTAGTMFKVSFSGMKKPSGKFIARCGIHLVLDER